MKRSLGSWLWRVPIDQEIDEELALHVEMRARELTTRHGSKPLASRLICSETSPPEKRHESSAERDREMSDPLP